MTFPHGSDGALCLCEDHEGNLWMGTSRKRALALAAAPDQKPLYRKWLAARQRVGSV